MANYSNVGLFMLICWFSNLNQLSLHYFYRDRLASAFLKTNIYDNSVGNIVPVRDQSEIEVQDINPPNCSAPYHLIVSSLNLSGSYSLTYKDSKSEPFIFSRYFCGSNNTGYSKTSIYRGGKTELGRALAISGAAFSSALGQYTFFAQAFIMTMLNIRLGYWMDNPREYNPQAMCEASAANKFIRLNRNDPFTLEPTLFWAKYLWHELSGTVHSNKRLINLSDGGHTDNLGLYPLLLRQCKLIIVSDAGGDSEYLFDDITRLIRRVNIEENIKIDINLEGLRPKSDGLSQHHCAVGKITYPKQSNNRGWLIYFKPTITAIEEGAVKAYWWTHRDDHFPHQTTLDQFYDDDQFEAYRHLGELTVFNTLKSCYAFYNRQHEDNSSLAQGLRHVFQQITGSLDKIDKQKRMELLRSVLKNLDEEPFIKFFKELPIQPSKQLNLEDIICDLKTVTSVWNIVGKIFLVKE